MTIIPCGHRVLIKPFKQADVDPSLQAAKRMGLQIVNNNQAREDASVDKGTVLAIGPNAWKAFDGGEPWCAVGDTVLFTKFAPKFVEDGKETYGLLNDDDVIAVIKETK